jgi:hypothetical protein
VPVMTLLSQSSLIRREVDRSRTRYRTIVEDFGPGRPTRRAGDVLESGPRTGVGLEEVAIMGMADGAGEAQWRNG